MCRASITFPVHRQLEFPARPVGVSRFSSLRQARISWRGGCDGYGCPGSQTVSRIGFANADISSRQEGRHGREDRPQVSFVAQLAECREATAGVSDATGSVCGRVAGGGRAVVGGAEAERQDPVRLAGDRAPRGVCRKPPADVRAAGAAVAGHGRSGPRGDVPTDPRGGRPGEFRFHQHESARDHAPGRAVRPPRVPLRLDLFELGIDHGLRVGVVRSVGRRVSECGLGTRRRTAAAPQRQPEGGGQQPVGEAGISDAVSRASGSLRGDGRADQRAVAERERGQRVGPRALQDRGRAGVVGARQPRFCEPGVVRRVPPKRGGDPKRRPWRALRRGVGRGAIVAAAADRQQSPRQVSGRFGQFDPHPPQHLLGAQSSDRRNGRGSPLCRSGRGVVCGPSRGHAAAVGRSGEVQGPVSAHHRLADPQTGSVRPLSLSRGFVPQ